MPIDFTRCITAGVTHGPAYMELVFRNMRTVWSLLLPGAPPLHDGGRECQDWWALFSMVDVSRLFLTVSAAVQLSRRPLYFCRCN